MSDKESKSVQIYKEVQKSPTQLIVVESNR